MDEYKLPMGYYLDNCGDDYLKYCCRCLQEWCLKRERYKEEYNKNCIQR
jgi:hypothetical protein